MLPFLLADGHKFCHFCDEHKPGMAPFFPRRVFAPTPPALNGGPPVSPSCIQDTQAHILHVSFVADEDGAQRVEISADRRIGMIRGTINIPNPQTQPYINTLSLVTWNSRSLYKEVSPGLCSKIMFHRSLCKSHMFVSCTETHSSIERVSCAASKFVFSHLHFFTHLNHNTCGNMLSVAKSFVSQCSWFNVVCGDAEGRVLMFMSDSAKGSLDIFSVDFDAQNPLCSY